MICSFGAASGQQRPAYQPATGDTQAGSSGSPVLPTQNLFSGSVPSGQPSSEVLQLSISDAIQRGLRQNLGLLASGDAVVAAKGQLWRERSHLLPNLSAYASENGAQVNLAALGIKLPGAPTIVGPYAYFDVRAGFSMPIVDLNALHTERAAARNLSADQLSFQDARETVVLIVAANYLQAIATQARVTTAEAQVQTAQTLYQQAADQRNAGLSAGIDLLRAQVELQTRQQELIAARNDFAKQKLAVARVIGLPLGQQFTLSDTAPYEATAPVDLGAELDHAYAMRADYKSALERVKAADLTRRAATAEHLPSLTTNADYGVIGPVPAQSHGTYSVAAVLHIPIFAGGKAHGDALAAQAALDRRQQELDNLRGQIEEEVRTAALDLQSAADQVTVAQSTQELARQTLVQAGDRFQAGAADNVEVVQAQEAVVRANESYISSLYGYNLARVRLARASGSVEQNITQYWKGK